VEVTCGVLLYADLYILSKRKGREYFEHNVVRRHVKPSCTHLVTLKYTEKNVTINGCSRCVGLKLMMLFFI